MCSDSLRQYFRNCQYKSPRRIIRTAFSISHNNLTFCLRKWDLLSCKAYKWTQKYSSRLLLRLSNHYEWRLYIQPFSLVLTFCGALMTSIYRSFCLYDQHPTASIQQSFCRSKALATVIATKWPAQTWYQQLLRMSIAPTIPLPNHPHCFIHLGLNPEPLHNRKWKVFAWRVSGRTNAGWSQRAKEQFSLSWANSTLTLNNRLQRKCELFCLDHNCTFSTYGDFNSF